MRLSAENELRKSIDKSYAEWFSKKILEEEIKKSQSIIRNELREKANLWSYTESSGNKIREVNIEDSESARNQWRIIAEDTVNSFFNEKIENQITLIKTDISKRLENISLSDGEIKTILEDYVHNYKNTILSEYNDISIFEENLLLRNVLYDQNSLRKKSDQEAAGIIARQIAKETEKTTGESLTQLFDQFQEQLDAGKLDNITLSESDWYVQFEKAINASLEKWSEAESSFLAARAEWEMTAENVYAQNEKVWQEAFAELESRKNAWNEKIYKEIQTIRDTLDARSDLLKKELADSLNNYQSLLSDQKASNEKTIALQENIYEQSRQLIELSTEGIDNWYKHWCEKYNAVYLYWKSQNSDKCKMYFGTTDSAPFNNELN